MSIRQLDLDETPTWLRDMNPEQGLAINHQDGPCVLLAQAGSGKTRVLVHRIQRMVAQGTDPALILAVTFAKKAADEMNNRLEDLDVKGARVGTWHSLCLQILKEDRTRWSDWTMGDKADGAAKQLLKEVLGYKHMDWKQADSAKVARFIGWCKAHLASPETEFAKEAARVQFERSWVRAVEAYALYEVLLKERGLLTYDDFLVFAHRHLSIEENRRKWAFRWTYLLQDECVVGETPVLLDGGSSLTIREIVERKYKGGVVSYDQKTGRSRVSKVVGWHKVPLGKRMVRLTIRRIGHKLDGTRFAPLTEQVRYRKQFVVCTYDHLVFVPETGWVGAGQLKAGVRVVSESDSVGEPGYFNRVKIGMNGRGRLSSFMRGKNEGGVCGTSREGNKKGPPVRGGNGRGPSPSEEALLARLGEGWVWNHVVKTGLSPRHGAASYKVDLVNLSKMIALEVDGSSHNSAERRDQDARKREFLESAGWTVVVVKNKDVPRLTDDLLHECVYNSPAPAEVLAVDEWVPSDPFVYDIDVQDTHCFYADGVLVHNCQDANLAQVSIAEMLARDHRNYLVVGDVAQSIFGFRGSSPSYLHAFATTWRATTIVMNRNYRSGRAIVDVANKVIAPAQIRLPTDMVAERGTEGSVRVQRSDTFDEEGEAFAEWVHELVQLERQPLSSICALFRTNAQSRALEEALLKKRIPYVVLGGMSFYDRKEVKDLLGYLRVAADRDDDEGDAVRRSLNAPFRFLGWAFVERVWNSPGDDWSERVLAAASTTGIQKRQVASANEWVRLVTRAKAHVAEGRKPKEILDEIVHQTDYVQWLERDQGEESLENSHAANVREILRIAERFNTAAELLDYIDEMGVKAARSKRGGGERVLLMSVHRCVSPDTLVETTSGVQEISNIQEEGTIGTAEGASLYEQKVTYQDRDMLRLTTKGGYSVEVTEDHEMMAWSYAEGDYIRKKAKFLKRGDFLRLRLGATIDVANAKLPPLPKCDVRAKKHFAPSKVTADVAEFFGLMVAGGTVFLRGFRLRKRHADVSHRFADLVFDLFGIRAEVTRGNNTYDVEISSVQIAAWLRSVGGLDPKRKHVPDCVLRSSLRSQAAFLRGLAEDGTVNVKDDRLDHVSWSSCYPRMAKVVQTMLLRQGIIAARKPRFGQWRIEIYGHNAHKFRDTIGFVSGYKTGLLQFPTGDEEGYVIPVESERLRSIRPERGTKAHWARQNGLNRGYVSRAGARLLGGYETELDFHHDKIARIEKFKGPAVCVAVPDVGRFLQDGFDGCNSKGLEWPNVWVSGCNENILPHAKGDPEEERRLMYVAITRARDSLVLSYVSKFARREGVRPAQPSRFLRDAGLVQLP
jgi:superfamily I DNA/RNA helicase/intein/homing endonuclease